MTSMKSLLLASSALLAAAAIMPAHAAPAKVNLQVAQAQNDNASADKKAEHKKKEDAKKKADRARHNDKKEEQRARKQNDDKKNQSKEQKGAPPRKAEGAPPHGGKPPAAAQQKQPAQTGKPATAAEKKTAEPHKKPSRPDKPAEPATRQAAPTTKPEPKQQPAAQQKQPAQKQAAPSQQPAEQQKPSQPSARQAAPAASPSKPAPSQSAAPAPPPGGNRGAASAPAPQLEPAKPQDAREFIRKDNQQPARTIRDVRQQRRTTQEEGRTFIHEGDRVIVRDHDRTFIRHNEDQRFAIGARDVRTDRRDGETITVIVRPNGVHIITVTDRQGHLIRRVRRNPDGQEIVIIDNRHAGPRGVFLDVRPPDVHMSRHRYIVDADRANRREIYDLLIAPPIQTIGRDYSLAQVRYNAPLREYMRRLDLDIHFDTGSWQITPAQMDRLSVVAEALNQAIERNPREVFLIEGHTDAVGSEDDNLSLSDRRAEAVAVALTEVFHVPPENLVTQGYGEQELKVDTQEASRANRRVALRRITPLIDRTAQR